MQDGSTVDEDDPRAPAPRGPLDGGPLLGPGDAGRCHPLRRQRRVGPGHTAAHEAGGVLDVDDDRRAGRAHPARGARRATVRVTVTVAAGACAPGARTVRAPARIAVRVTSGSARIAVPLGEGAQRLDGLPLGELDRAEPLDEPPAQQRPGVLHPAQQGHERSESAGQSRRERDIRCEDAVTVQDGLDAGQGGLDVVDSWIPQPAPDRCRHEGRGGGAARAPAARAGPARGGEGADGPASILRARPIGRPGAIGRGGDPCRRRPWTEEIRVASATTTTAHPPARCCDRARAQTAAHRLEGGRGGQAADGQSPDLVGVLGVGVDGLADLGRQRRVGGVEGDLGR